MGTDESAGLQSKYQRVKEHITQAIEVGVYQSGDKLPSIRQLSQELTVSKNTVIRAYQELEANQMVTAVAKSGYRVSTYQLQPDSPMAPAEIDLLGVCKEILTYPQYKELLPAGSAHPNVDGAAIKSLYAEIGRQSRMQAHIASHYQLPPGEQTLVKQLAKITQDLGTLAPIEELLVTHGAQQAISLALRAITKPGDIVAVESPCYFGNLLLLESLGLQVVEIPSCPKDGMNIAALENAMESWGVKAILVTPNFTNPTGAMMPLEARKELLAISRDTPIIEDDVFGCLSYQKPLPSLRSLDNDQRVIYVNSLSKNLDSRLRIGWMLAGRYRQQIEQHLLCDNMGSLNLMQSAVSSFLNSGKYKTHVAKMRNYYQNNVKRFLSMFVTSMNRHNKVKGQYRVTPVHGSFLLWIELPKGTDCYALYRECKSHKISILPGSVFGTCGQYQHCFRVSVANLGPNSDWHSPINLLTSLINRQLTSR